MIFDRGIKFEKFPEVKVQMLKQVHTYNKNIELKIFIFLFGFPSYKVSHHPNNRLVLVRMHVETCYYMFYCNVLPCDVVGLDYCKL